MQNYSTIKLYIMLWFHTLETCFKFKIISKKKIYIQKRKRLEFLCKNQMCFRQHVLSWAERRKYPLPQHRTPVVVNMHRAVCLSYVWGSDWKKSSVGQNAVRATGDYVTCRLYLVDIALSGPALNVDRQIFCLERMSCYR